MSCEKLDQDEYEQSVAEYVRGALPDPERAEVYIERVPVAWSLQTDPDSGESIEIPIAACLEVTISFPDPYPCRDGELDPTAVGLAEVRPLDDGRMLAVWDRIDGTQTHIIYCPPQQPQRTKPWFSITLEEWPLHDYEALGPRFLEGLKLIVEAFDDSSTRYWASLRRRIHSPCGPDSVEDSEAAERLEPDPQPQDHDHPCERGESP